MHEPIAKATIDLFLAALAGRTPTPGGGAAAGLAGAIGASLGTMAAHYTTGAKWADRELEARGLAQRLDHAATRLLELAEEDAQAFADYQKAKRADPPDPDAVARAEAAAATIPARTLRECATASEALAAFADRCNPRLRADLRAAIHLLRGAGQSAYEILLCNDPDPDLKAEAKLHRDSLREAERASRRR